jgi:hypothetical protein
LSCKPFCTVNRAQLSTSSPSSCGEMAKAIPAKQTAMANFGWWPAPVAASR